MVQACFSNQGRDINFSIFSQNRALTGSRENAPGKRWVRTACIANQSALRFLSFLLPPILLQTLQYLCWENSRWSPWRLRQTAKVVLSVPGKEPPSVGCVLLWGRGGGEGQVQSTDERRQSERCHGKVTLRVGDWCFCSCFLIKSKGLVFVLGKMESPGSRLN